jgi:putative flavoprotein involved in K+ transport
VITADQVIVAAAGYQEPKFPGFAKDLDPAIVQIHSNEYRNPAQLSEGEVLIVGAGNSGAEIAMDIISRHKVWLSGRNVGDIPFPIAGFLGRKLLVRLVLRGVFHRILTVRTPIGRKVRSHFLKHGATLVRQRSGELKKAGVARVPRVAGVKNGLPCLEDGRTLDVRNVVWCTGFHPGLTWIDLPIFGEDGYPRHERGIVTEQDGLYFLGLHFLYSVSSGMVHGVGRDARRITGKVTEKISALKAA